MKKFLFFIPGVFIKKKDLTSLKLYGSTIVLNQSHRDRVVWNHPPGFVLLVQQPRIYKFQTVRLHLFEIPQMRPILLTHIAHYLPAAISKVNNFKQSVGLLESYKDPQKICFFCHMTRDHLNVLFYNQIQKTLLI